MLKTFCYKITLKLEAITRLDNQSNPNICNIYLSSGMDLDKQELIDLSEPKIILGDFNGHNLLWSSTSINRKSQISEK